VTRVDEGTVAFKLEEVLYTRHEKYNHGEPHRPVNPNEIDIDEKKSLTHTVHKHVD
jgi:hypothetical protein